jgi:GTP-binding protein HflX
LLFERPGGGERAVLVHIDFADSGQREDPDEFRELAASAGAETAAFVYGQRKSPQPRFYIGTGKLDQIKQLLASTESELVIFNHALSPSQERNLERELCCRVLDRTGLILDIFAQRARTHEGKLQVELAQLQHMSTRLVRGWTHLERQKGGIGLRGPGETQLESDRRLLRARINAINSRLEKVRSQRNQGRRARRRANVASVSLVGYTNAGKSTLFNTLTNSSVYSADQLFATLDPTLRRLDISGFGPVVLADTVGFIRHLPHKLVEAFRATLEEASSSELLLHVVDAADENRRENVEQVEAVLAEIGADETPRLEIYNKIDMLAHVETGIDRDQQGKPLRVWVSAQSGAGMELIGQAIAELLGVDTVHQWLALAPRQGKLRASLYAAGTVLSESASVDGSAKLEIQAPRADLLRLLAREVDDPEGFLEACGAVDESCESSGRAAN